MRCKLSRILIVTFVTACTWFADRAEAGEPPLPVLQIDAAKVIGHVSPLHAGLMTEEINHSYDGGLYAELISNRAFMVPLPLSDGLPPHWSLLTAGSGAGVIAADDTQSLSDVLTRSSG